jgi:hypothetical protein
LAIAIRAAGDDEATPMQARAIGTLPGSSVDNGEEESVARGLTTKKRLCSPWNCRLLQSIRLWGISGPNLAMTEN